MKIKRNIKIKIAQFLLKSEFGRELLFDPHFTFETETGDRYILALFEKKYYDDLKNECQINLSKVWLYHYRIESILENLKFDNKQLKSQGFIVRFLERKRILVNENIIKKLEEIQEAAKEKRG